jgi:large subunit ribosomal protein L13
MTIKMTNKTHVTKAADITAAWHVIDAKDQVLGRLATNVAKLLMGKHKPIFTRTMDTGDHVIVINADKIRVTGAKSRQKMYYRHSGYPGGFKSVSLEKLMPADPTLVVKHAIKGMLPHNKMGAQMLRKLKVYAGDSHPHQAQLEAPPKVKARPAVKPRAARPRKVEASAAPTPEGASGEASPEKS